MTQTQPEPPRSRRMWRTLGMVLYRWHRRLGIFSALFVLWLAISGLVLHHTDLLGLDPLRLSAPWLTHWYGLSEVAPETGYVAGAHWLMGTDEATVLDGAALIPPIPQALGMIETEHFLAVATPHALVLLTPQGQRIDELKGAQLPVEDLHKLGIGSGRIIIRDERTYASADGEAWSAFDGPTQWSQEQPLSPEQRAQAAPLLRPSLSVVRILSDAHSGRLFGRFGPLAVDVAALAFILLALSGVWIYTRRRAR